MKFVSIFDDQLYVVHYDDEEDNEWDRLIELWGDVEYLRQFAIENGLEDIKSFVESITDKADDLDDFLDALEKIDLNLDNYFRPLDDHEVHEVLLSKRKGKWQHNSLRIYAIRIDENCYVVTGGALKMTHKMKDHPDTAKEIPKLEKVRNHLIDQDIIDKDSFFEYLEQEQ